MHFSPDPKEKLMKHLDYDVEQKKGDFISKLTFQSEQFSLWLIIGNILFFWM